MRGRIKIDEDLPRVIEHMLRSRGLDAVSVREQGLQGKPDAPLWGQIQAEGRCLMTADKGFADLSRYAPGSHEGIVLLRSRDQSRYSLLALATLAADSLNLESMIGTIAVVTEHGIRVRRPPKP
jgi:predicted nuclease of predicted toxin-antitoxin system